MDLSLTTMEAIDPRSIWQFDQKYEVSTGYFFRLAKVSTINCN